jgi:hypothetical protein
MGVMGGIGPIEHELDEVPPAGQVELGTKIGKRRAGCVHCFGLSKVARGGFGYRILAGFYRIIYRLLPDKWRGLPHLTAYYRLLPHNDFVRWSAGVLEYWGERSGQRRREWTFAGKSADFHGLLREVARKFAQIRAVVPRCHAFLRVTLFFRREFHE